MVPALQQNVTELGKGDENEEEVDQDFEDQSPWEAKP